MMPRDAVESQGTEEESESNDNADIWAKLREKYLGKKGAGDDVSTPAESDEDDSDV